MVCEPDDRAGPLHLIRGIFHGAASGFIDDLKHVDERFAFGFVDFPSRKRFSNGIHSDHAGVGVGDNDRIADALENARRLGFNPAQVERCFREFEFSAAVQVLYGFFWNDFCDWYVEVSKAKLQSAATKENCIALQDFAIRQTLLLLHPFIPFITEELWQLLGYGAPGTYLINARTEDAAALTAALGQAGVAIDQAASAKIATLKESFTVLRAKKAEIGLASAPVAVLYYEPRPGYDEFFVNPNYLRMLGSRELRVGQLPDGLAGVSSVTNAATFYIPLPEKDSEAEKARLTAELADLAKHIAATQARLANVAFTAKAPPAVIEGAQRQLAELQKKYDEVRRLLAALG